jgi:predicted DNA-binding transcriptional regulator AlpA
MNQTTSAPVYGRAKDVSAHFKISRSTLWRWIKEREGFPQPIHAGARVTLFDLNAITAYLINQSASASTK